MKTLSKKRGLAELRRLKAEHRDTVRDAYEFRAKDCATCETPGACCLDAHFVNVHVTRLEAELMKEELTASGRLEEAGRRIAATIERYGLRDDEESAARTFACPLFEKGVGCLVHEVKPAPCIQHACYERPDDLPPDELQEHAEMEIEKLNLRVYRDQPRWKPLPIALQEVG